MRKIAPVVDDVVHKAFINTLKQTKTKKKPLKKH